ncbi:NUDIX hydrolase [Patescibacteria group bacterium]|nr:NUDIX hydrolase [Patescibacteria group bacterium]
MKNPWQKISSKIIYKNQWLKFIEDKVIHPGGNKGIYSYIKKLPAAIIIPLTKKKEIYFVGQWRYTINKYSWELPMGTAEKGETLLKSAKRELLEEVNLKAKKWNKVGTFYFANGALSQSAHVYLARDLSKSEGISDDTESFRIKKLTFSQIEKMIEENKIFDSDTITAYYKLKLFLKNENIK